MVAVAHVTNVVIAVLFVAIVVRAVGFLAYSLQLEIHSFFQTSLFVAVIIIIIILAFFVVFFVVVFVVVISVASQIQLLALAFLEEVERNCCSTFGVT